MDSFARLKETELPPIECFASRLKGGDGGISPEDYLHAQAVWKAAACKNLKDYTSFYMKVDVLGLADVFDKFRNDCLQSYNMDPIFFYSLPGFAWAAMLRTCPVDLDKISDYEMFCMLEQGIRGGLSVVSKHYTNASNYYTNPEKYSCPDSEGSRYIYLLDANGLYSWAMTQPLPYGDFKWEEDIQLLEKMFSQSPTSCWPADDGDRGYILTVDLEYPSELHDYTAAYPLAPAHESVSLQDYSLIMLQQWCHIYPEKSSIKPEYKLVGSCREKKFYVVHYRELKFYVKMGVKISRIHNAISFKQQPFMKNYIDFNITQRKANSSDKLKSDLFKKLNNAVYGKTQEQQRRHMNFKLSSEPVEQQKIVSGDGYLGSIVFQDDLVGFHLQKDRVVLRHPIYIGMTVLGLSKVLMFTFYYDVLKPLFGNDMTLCYTDTDSLLLEFTGADVLKRLATIAPDWIDGSNLPQEHPLYSLENKGKLGYFKDEMDGEAIKEGVILRPKMYCLLTESGEQKKRAKGIKQSVVKSLFTINDYREVFRECISTDDDDGGGECSCSPAPTVSQVNFRSVRHEVQTIEQKKKSLALFDNKRYWLDTVSSLPFGHYKEQDLQEKTLENRKNLVWNRLKMSPSEFLRENVPLRKQRRPYQHPDEFTPRGERIFDRPVQLKRGFSDEDSCDSKEPPMGKRRRKGARPIKIEGGLR